MTKAAVERWVSKALLSPGPDGASALSRVVLRHAAGPKGETVGEWQINPAADSSSKLAASIYETAESDAEGLGGQVQRYVLRAYYGDAEAAGRCVFRIVLEEESADAFNSEPATQAGAFAQMMRHNEAAMRIGIGACQTAVNQFQKHAEVQASRVTELEERLAETRERADANLDKRYEWEERKRAEERAEKRQEQMMQMLQMLAPLVMAKLAGGLLPGMTAPRDLVIDKLLDSVTPKQFEVMKENFSPEQMALFAHAYETRILDKQEPAPAPAPANLARVNGHGGTALWQTKGKWCSMRPRAFGCLRAPVRGLLKSSSRGLRALSRCKPR